MSNQHGYLKHIGQFLLKVIGYGMIFSGIVYMGMYAYYSLVIKPAKMSEVAVITSESQVSTIEPKVDTLKPETPTLKPKHGVSNVYEPTDLMRSMCSYPSDWSIEKCAEYQFDQADFINSSYFTKAGDILKNAINSSSDLRRIYTSVDADFEEALESLTYSKPQFEIYRDSFCDADYWQTQGSKRDSRLYNCKEKITKQYTYDIWNLLMRDPAERESSWPSFPEPIFGITLGNSINVLTDKHESTFLGGLDPEGKICFQNLSEITTPAYAEQAFKASDILRLRVKGGLIKSDKDGLLSNWKYPCGLLKRKLYMSEGEHTIWYDVDFNGDLKILAVR